VNDEKRLGPLLRQGLVVPDASFLESRRRKNHGTVPLISLFHDQGRVTYELILSSLQLFLKKLVFLRAILYNEAWEKNFMP